MIAHKPCCKRSSLQKSQFKCVTAYQLKTQQGLIVTWNAQNFTVVDPEGNSLCHIHRDIHRDIHREGDIYQPEFGVKSSVVGTRTYGGGVGEFMDKSQKLSVYNQDSLVKKSSTLNPEPRTPHSRYQVVGDAPTPELVTVLTHFPTSSEQIRRLAAETSLLKELNQISPFYSDKQLNIRASHQQVVQELCTFSFNPQASEIIGIEPEKGRVWHSIGEQIIIDQFPLNILEKISRQLSRPMMSQQSQKSQKSQKNQQSQKSQKNQQPALSA